MAEAPFETVSLQVFRNLFSSVAEEMGIVLRLAGYSANISTRLDFSCAAFQADGLLLAQAAHIPVHLGAMSLAMKAILENFELVEGDVAILNDPFHGGTHLPDISLVSPVFVDGQLAGFVMSRAHHSDIGGMTPASMPLASEIVQEGLRIPPMLLACAGELDHKLLELIEANVRTPVERRGDILAQLSAQMAGERRLREMGEKYGIEELRHQATELLRYADRVTRGFVSELPAGTYEAEDWLDNDGMSPERVRLHVEVRIGASDKVRVDFSGSSDQVSGPVNAVSAVTRAAMLYVLRCLVDEDVPVNDGMLRSVELITRPGSVLDAREPAAVSSGNVETSQRIVDLLFRVFAQIVPHRVPAASQGTMNNLAIGGYDWRRRRPFTYYETIGGGQGARPTKDGSSGFHDHMSNTLNTPTEVLESRFPLRVRRYELRTASGGDGKHRGGAGVIREIEFLTKARVTVMSDRRETAPYGLFGATPGAKGSNRLLSNDKAHSLPSKAVFDVSVGDRVLLETPGGGGRNEPPGTSRDRT